MEEDGTIKRTVRLSKGSCPPLVIDAASFVGTVAEFVRANDELGLWKVGGGLQAFTAEANRRLDILEAIAPEIHIVSSVRFWHRYHHLFILECPLHWPQSTSPTKQRHECMITHQHTNA